MRPADWLQVLGTAVSLFVLGFGTGAAFAARRRSARALRRILETVRLGLTNIEVVSLRVTPATAALGTQVVIDFDIVSKLPAPFEVWLGADIPYETDRYFYNVDEDKVVSIELGRHTYSRYLTLAHPLSSGSWAINGGVWFGKRSHPDRSLRLILRPVEISIK